jgi:hypothetical protein
LLGDVVNVLNVVVAEVFGWNGDDLVVLFAVVVHLYKGDGAGFDDAAGGHLVFGEDVEGVVVVIRPGMNP